MRKPRAAPTPSTWEPRPMERQIDGKGWGVLGNPHSHLAPYQSVQGSSFTLLGVELVEEVWDGTVGQNHRGRELP